MKKIIASIFLFCISNRIKGQEVPMDMVKIPVSRKLLADTIKFAGDIREKGDGFIIIDQGSITVIGTALYSKGGALIRMDENFYFIEGLYDWPKDISNKKVRAIGRCVIYDYRKLMRRNPFMQGFHYKKALRDAKWEVVE